MRRGTVSAVKRTALAFAAALLLSVAALAAGRPYEALLKPNAPQNAVWVDSLDIADLQRSGGGVLKAGAAYFGGPLMLNRGILRHGIGTYGESFAIINLNGSAVKFEALVGINEDRPAGKGSVIFQVWIDGKKAAESPVMRSGDKPYYISADLTGKNRLALVTDSADDGMSDDAADWGGALIKLDPAATARPLPAPLTDDPAMAIAATNFKELGIHGPRVTGATPGLPFLFLIPATGDGPLTFEAKGLPEGLTLDPRAGIISGSLKNPGETIVELTVKDKNGAAKRKLKIVGGKHRLAMTPPMGWNSWNVWGLSVDDAKVRAAADSFVSTGLASYGFQYINIDDGWEKGRAANGEIVLNDKFPDMKKLSDYVHSRGLKLGIYSSPGPKTCGGYEGSWEHEYQDAASYANWGIDYLKYDWCSYGGKAKDNSLPELKKPYFLMRDALDKAGRDIVFSLCQYGMGNVSEWGEEVGGDLWRTTGDITDNWGSMSGIGFGQNSLAKYAAPSAWNDPDMLVVGKVGWGPNIHPTRLSQNEQITHITLWSILAAPLLIGCDLTQIDQFTLDLLTNGEVLDVNQDPLGKQGSRVAKDGLSEVWARTLFDGTKAVAVFNRFMEKQSVTVKWADLGLSGSQPVRDLWLKKDLGAKDGSITVEVPAHGAVMLKVGKPARTDIE